VSLNVKSIYINTVCHLQWHYHLDSYSMAIGNLLLTDKDKDNIRAFQLKITCNMPRCVFNCMHHTFHHKMDIDSEWVILHRVTILSGIQPNNYHCCINSCITYTNDYTDLDHCPFCDKPQCMSNGQPWHIFSYIPLLPCLQALLQSPSTIGHLSYH